MSFPVVSVCIPTYNGINFLEEALNSIRQQTYPELEVIISDDGSQDETVNLIHASSLPNARIFTHSRYGLVANWNYCITMATGKYIKFLFQDDTVEPDCISKLVKVAEQDSNIGLVFCRRRLIEQELFRSPSNIKDLHKGWYDLQPVQAGIELLQDINLMKAPDNKIGEPTNVLIRKEVFKQVGNFDSSFKQLADLEMWFRIMTSYKIAFIDEELASFRIHPNQTTIHNLTDKQSWAEIYQIWLKLIHEPIYHVILASTRQQIKTTLLKRLLREYLKIIFFRRWHRWKKMNALLIQALL